VENGVFSTCASGGFTLTIIFIDAKIPYDGTFVKAQLLELVRENKHSPLYMAVAVATMYGRQVQYKPSHNPKLQLIELIWGQV
jgi:hypothetical protein